MRLPGMGDEWREGIGATAAMATAGTSSRDAGTESYRSGTLFSSVASPVAHGGAGKVVAGAASALFGSDGSAFGLGARAFFDFQPPHRKPVQLLAKRAIDVAGALAGLLVLLPVLLVIAVLIKATSRGPVLFTQERTGVGNRTFRIYKFRSMYTDLCDRSGVTQTVDGDPRITPIGRVLRRTNLDELPQLINVLVGDMSLVGPRPHVPGMLAAGLPYEDLVDGYEHRHFMRPGITGLAQVHGLRGPTTEVEPSVLRIARDLEYIRDFSLWLDLKILVRTIVVEARGGTGL
jgi:lipopolysaccharide/colanic/teichoic acid biosynthesis glycosyltransferase